jgi:hypothetical protein
MRWRCMRRTRCRGFVRPATFTEDPTRHEGRQAPAPSQIPLMLEKELPGSRLMELLRFELESLEALTQAEAG